MRSVRLDPELDARLQRAASMAGESVSEFLRRAAAERADAVLDQDGGRDFSDILGAISGGGGRARNTGRAFADLLGRRQE